jgi:hypothetical protein
LYTEWTSSIDWAKEPLSLLEVAGQPKKVKQLPSWVPDWSYSSLRIPLARGDGEHLYYVSKTTDRPGFTTNPNGNVLHVRGGLFDVIAKTTEARWDHEERDYEINGIMSSLILQFNELTNHLVEYPTKEKMSDVLYKTLTGNVHNIYDGTLTNYAKILEEYRAHLEDSARGGQAAIQGRPRDGANTPARFRPFVAAAREVCRTRKFCLAAKGYVGQIPSEALSGDRICIILAEKVPFIVRSAGTSSRLIGDAYIHGIMQGEGLDHLEDLIGDIALM